MVFRAFIRAVPVSRRRPFPVLLLALLALHAFPSDAVAGSGDDEYRRGRELLTLGKHAQAQETFRRAVSANPDHVEARYQLGLLYSRNILTYDKAEKEFLEIPEIAMRAGGSVRDDILFRSGLALSKLYLKSNHAAKAAQLARNVIASAPPGSPLDDAYNVLGVCLYYQRFYGDAIFELKRAIKINPNHVEAKFNLKTIRSRLEHFHAGKIYSRMGERPQAISEFRKAIDLDPRFVEARHRLGAELYADGRYEEAFTELRRADSLSEDYGKAFEIWYAQGLALRRLGRPGEALRLLERTVEARPRFAPAHNEIGEILLEEGETDAAIQRFVTAIGIDPRTEYVRNLQLGFGRKGAN